MNGEHAKLLHDVRAPLARAKTIAKLLQQSTDGAEELLPELLKALEELDEMLAERLSH